MQNNNVSTEQIDDTVGNLTGRATTLDAIGNYLLESDGQAKPVQWFRYYQQQVEDKWSAANPATEDQEFRSMKPELSSMFITTYTDKEPDGGETPDARCFFLGRWVIFDIDFRLKDFLPPVLRDTPEKATPEQTAQAHRQARLAAISAAHELVGKLEAQGLDARCLRLYASGGKGFHVYVPLEAFTGDWWEWLSAAEMQKLPEIFKEVSNDPCIKVPGLDHSIYNRRKGRMIREPNAKRPDGKFKVPITLDEFRNITPTLYDEYVTAPRPEPETIPTEKVSGLAKIWCRAGDVAISDTPDTIITPPTPEKINRIRSMVDAIDPDYDGDDAAHTLRRKVLQAVRLELGYDAGYKIVESFVNRSRSRKFKNKEWKMMYRAMGKTSGKLVTAATLRSLADDACQREHGHKWIDPDPSQNPKHAPIINGEVNDEATPERLTEKGMAEFLAAKYRNRLRYLEDMATWITWNGREWEFDADGSCIHTLLGKEARRLLAQAYRDQAQGIADLPADADKETRKAAENRMAGQIKFYRGLDGASTIRNIKSLVQHEPNLRIGSMLLDQHPELLNVDNGVLNLATGELRPHASDLLLTQRAFVEWLPGATCPRWLQFVDEITCGDKALADYLQCVIGYTLSGDISRHEAYFLHGDGANGKSVLMNTLRALLGGYCKSLSVDAIMVKRDAGGPTPDLLAVRGARMAITSEMSAGRQLNEGVFKDLVSGDTIPVRGMYAKQIIQMRFLCKVFMPTNTLPTIAGQDYGIRRRIYAIPFDRTFDGADRDTGLEAKLKAELPGILAWSVAGYRRYRSEGFAAPESVRNKTEGYLDDLDIVKHFVEDAMIQDDAGRQDAGEIPAAVLAQVYDHYCRTMNHPSLGGVRFGREVKKHIPRQRHTRTGKCYLGWRVKYDWMPVKLREELDTERLAAVMDIYEG